MKKITVDSINNLDFIIKYESGELSDAETLVEEDES